MRLEPGERLLSIVLTYEVRTAEGRIVERQYLVHSDPLVSKKAADVVEFPTALDRTERNSGGPDVA